MIIGEEFKNVIQDGEIIGLKPCAHTLSLREHLKISYVPMGFSGADTKVLQLAA
jgi:hypothetical protein